MVFSKKHSRLFMVPCFAAAIAACAIIGYSVSCNTAKPTGPAPRTAAIVHFPKDTLLWNIPFSDTLHSKDLSAAQGASFAVHLMDSQKGMSVHDSVFLWTPEDTGTVYINATVCGSTPGCDTLRDTLHIRFASATSRPYRLRRDTVIRFVRFTDTLRPDSAFKARFGNAVFSLRMIDSVANMSAHDSIFSWVPLDTATMRFRVGRRLASGPMDTLWVTLKSINGPLPIVPFHFRADTVCYTWLYQDTLRASRFSTTVAMGRLSGFVVIAGPTGMSVKDSVLTWVPWDSGKAPVDLAARDTSGTYHSIKDTFFVRKCSPDMLCPPYTHKNDATVGAVKDLPNGFFVYSNEYYISDAASGPLIRPGLWISDLKKFAPALIPGTETDYPRSIKISDDGKWVLYVHNNNVYLVRTDGSVKRQVDLSGVSVNMACFYRNGPNGAEICYTTFDTVRCEMFAIKVNLDSVPTFGAIRTLYDLTGSFRLEPYYEFAVAKDQVLGPFSLRIPSGYALRMGFLTIPNAGRGIAGAKDMYAWKNDMGKQYWGCNATMSHDGSQCLYIPGIAGDASVYQPCVPQEHRGFVVTPFRRSGDSAITMDDHIDVYGLSINWCPSQYNFGTWDQMDFHGWYFGNNNSLAIGCLAGTSAPYKGIWMVDWKRNVWTKLTPDDSIINAEQPAVFFTDTDTGNPLDPQYRVISPNGGEVFTVGQPCTVTVSSRRAANAAVRLKIANGKYSFLLPGMTSAVNPRVDSVFVFTMPDSFTIKQPDPQTGNPVDAKISSVSDSCRVCVQDYTATSGFSDCSDGVFKIKAAH